MCGSWSSGLPPFPLVCGCLVHFYPSACRRYISTIVYLLYLFARCSFNLLRHCDGDKKKLPLSMNQPVLSLTIQASARVLSLKAPCSGISPFPLQRQSYSNCYQSLHLFSIAHQLQRRRLRRRRRQPSSQVQSRRVSGAQSTTALEATLQRRPKVARQPLEPTRPP
jgi:hypothetical protein